tara:strand:- start:1567 stop:1827 length:261 start_codon:yes stop_codon:yes gene_type:complete
MKSFIKNWFGFFLSQFLVICLCFHSVEAQPLSMITADSNANDQAPLNSKSIDDLLGPETNFPFDPANHRDGSNPIKRIGKISDDNL